MQGPNHGVERIGDADDEGIGGMAFDSVGDRLHHLQIDAEQIVPAHAWLARDARSDDHDIGAGYGAVIIGAADMRVETGDRSGLRQVERFTLRRPFRDIEEDDVAQFLEADKMGKRAADLTCADQCDLFSPHRNASAQLLCCVATMRSDAFANYSGFCMPASDAFRERHKYEFDPK